MDLDHLEQRLVTRSILDAPTIIQNIVDRALITDPKMLALPHPARTYRAGDITDMLNELHPDLCRTLRSGTLTVMDQASLLSRYFSSAKSAASRYMNPESPVIQQLVGVSVVESLAMLQALHQWPIFRSTPILGEWLEVTDYDRITGENLVLPYPAMYLSCAQTQPPVTLFDQETGDHDLEGAYLLMDRAGDITKIGFALIGMPKGVATNDTVLTFMLEIGPADVGRAIDQIYTNAARTYGWDEHHEQHVIRALQWIGKHLLYLNCRNARLRHVAAPPDQTEKIAALGPKKRAKMARRAARTYPYILVGPEHRHQVENKTEARSGIRPHWRRGHMHLVCTGPGKAQRELRYFEPVWVGGGTTSAPKSYRIR